MPPAGSFEPTMFSAFLRLFHPPPSLRLPLPRLGVPPPARLCFVLGFSSHYSIPSICPFPPPRPTSVLFVAVCALSGINTIKFQTKENLSHKQGGGIPSERKKTQTIEHIAGGGCVFPSPRSVSWPSPLFPLPFPLSPPPVALTRARNVLVWIVFLLFCFFFSFFIRPFFFPNHFFLVLVVVLSHYRWCALCLS